MTKGISEIACLLCKGETKLVLPNHPGYLAPTTFDIYHCNHCNTSFSMPRSDSGAVYELIYRNPWGIPGYSRYWRYAEEIKRVKEPLAFLAEQEEMYWATSESLLHAASKSADELRVLEIGSGLGYLTYALQRAGFDATGLDISAKAVEQASSAFGDFYINDDLYNFSQNHAACYDVVIMTEVIEHVEDAVSFLATAKTLLKEDGYILVTTPNKGFYPDYTIWETDVPPIHCWWFSVKSMEYIAKSIDMDVKFQDFTSYYKKHKTVIPIKSSCHINVRRHVLNADFQVNAATNGFKEEQPPLKRIWKKFAIRTGLRSVLQYLEVKLGIGKKCSAEGVTLCAIYFKRTV